MALHPDFPESPHEIIDPSVRWLPDQTLLLGMEYGMLLPPLVQKVREQVKGWRDSNYSDDPKQAKHYSIGGSIHPTCENRLTGR